MKKITTLLIFALVSVTLLAETSVDSDSSNHLTFKGIPINGKINEFVSKLKLKGFKHEGTEEGLAILSGDFAGYKGCLIGVPILKHKDMISKVSVIFPACTTWSSLESNYNFIQRLLTKKYGEPSEMSTKFQSSVGSSDIDKFINVQLGDCQYYSIYKTDKGHIELSIEADALNCFVYLSYLDKINSDYIEREAFSDL